MVRARKRLSFVPEVRWTRLLRFIHLIPIRLCKMLCHRLSFREVFVYGLFVAWLVAPFPSDRAEAKEAFPNIVIVLADDLGWGDPQCYQADSQIPTPAIDRLASEGMLFTDAHSPSSVCTPTRYSLLTGRYAWRTRLTSGVLDGFDPPLLQEGEDTLGTLLRRAGYRTHCIGKWHLGMQWKDAEGALVGDRDVSGGFRAGRNIDFESPVTGGPNDVGFDSFFGIAASLDMSPYLLMRDRRVIDNPTRETVENRDGLFMNQVAGVSSDGFRVEDVLPRIVDQAENVILQAADQPEPFFCYIPLTSPHLPIVPTEGASGVSNAGRYGDFVVATDRALARVLDALEKAGVQEETLVLFSSDNGGLFHQWEFRADDDGGSAPVTRRGAETFRYGHQSNADWRGTKADIYEGGHRVPLLVRWPGIVKAGTVCDAAVELTDVFATVADLTGQGGIGDSGMDSFSLMPCLLGDEEGTQRPYCVHHSSRGMFAIRRGAWKLILGQGSGGFSVPRALASSQPDGQLYNLLLDRRETRNVFNQELQRASAMKTLMSDIRERGAVQVAAELGSVQGGGARRAMLEEK